MAAQYGLFIDHSVDTGDISDDLDDQRIREIIRDDYLQDSTVTIVLVGTETKKRKHVDWETYSSMIDGKVNKKSGLIALALPSIKNSKNCVITFRGREEQHLYPSAKAWRPLRSRTEYEQKWPSMPPRIVDNLFSAGARISVTSWHHIKNRPHCLRTLIELTFRDRAKCKYDLRRPMRRENS